MGSDVIKMCSSCAYAIGTLEGAGRCARTGDYMSLQRMWPNKRCDDEFSGWVQKPTAELAMRAWWQKIWRTEP